MKLVLNPDGTPIFGGGHYERGDGSVHFNGDGCTPSSTATGDIREQLHNKLDWFTEPGTGVKHLSDLEDDLWELMNSYKQQVLDELEGRLPNKRYTRDLGSTRFNECLTQVHQLIKDMKGQA